MLHKNTSQWKIPIVGFCLYILDYSSQRLIDHR